MLSIFREIKHIDTIWNNKYTHTFYSCIFLSLDVPRTVTDAEQGLSVCHFSLTANYQHASGFFPSTLLILISAALYSFAMLGWAHSNIFVRKKNFRTYKNLTSVFKQTSLQKVLHLSLSCVKRRTLSSFRRLRMLYPFPTNKNRVSFP